MLNSSFKCCSGSGDFLVDYVSSGSGSKSCESASISWIYSYLFWSNIVRPIIYCFPRMLTSSLALPCPRLVVPHYHHWLGCSGRNSRGLKWNGPFFVFFQWLWIMELLSSFQKLSVTSDLPVRVFIRLSFPLRTSSSLRESRDEQHSELLLWQLSFLSCSGFRGFLGRVWISGGANQRQSHKGHVVTSQKNSCCF